ncbi:hypothetical protein F5050DRAFT_318557 [Lentinula boryana]|uniref:Uncharacterized protein n=1 Tax=Lentinula boryana TaxID=40481 RepID=A0ABQ8QA98_9AGAR|nr:hypothetical protein F5050DRAFT_318557 [Lentinula boryana]
MDMDEDVYMTIDDSVAPDIVMEDKLDGNNCDDDQVDEQNDIEKVKENENFEVQDDEDSNHDHFPRIVSSEVDDDDGEDPYLSDSVLGKWAKFKKHRREWVYTVDMYGPLTKFSELSTNKAQEEKKAIGEKHRAFWSDKKDHGLEDIRDRFRRFSDEVTLRIPRSQNPSGILESYSEGEIEEMENCLEAFDRSFLNSKSYHKEFLDRKGKGKERAIDTNNGEGIDFVDDLSPGFSFSFCSKMKQLPISYNANSRPCDRLFQTPSRSWMQRLTVLHATRTLRANSTCIAPTRGQVQSNAVA